MLSELTLQLAMQLIMKIHDDIPQDQRTQFWIDNKDFFDKLKSRLAALLP